jgi:hypothetical protein
MDPLELERLIDRKLKQLPQPQAPRTLLPRVLHAVRASAPAPAPASGPAWRTWPVSWQAAAVAAFVLIALGAVNLWPIASEAIYSALTPPASGGSGVANVLHELDAIASATRVVWRVLVQPMAVFVCAVVAVMTAACALFGTALGRVALGGASRL